MSCFFFRQLASHGIMVLAVEHTDGTASRTVQDEVASAFNPFLMSPGDQQSRRALDLISAPSALPEDLRELVNKDAIFFGGHSYGGPSAVLAGLVATRSSRPLRGVILLDPAIALVGVNELPPVPVLTFLSEEYDINGVRAGTSFMCRGAMHGNFVDAALWAPLWVMRLVSLVLPAAGSAEPNALHAALSKACARFMNSTMSEVPKDGILEDGAGYFVERSGGLSGGRSLSRGATQ
eukprot:TRINITY_DN36485_c0_g1_i1.p1 TRINITY_DN36485_c0_g1~~TRINITY_DN36485_c0_g1_i1.p1  ORF type:complete len:262 (-),score=15.29 TRINITY_DN36485_c0_g1_i1:295-1002(-)